MFEIGFPPPKKTRKKWKKEELRDREKHSSGGERNGLQTT